MTQWVKDTAKNLTDFNCDWNPIYRAAAPPETCHQVAEHIGNEAGKLADNPAGYVAKKALDGTINQILTNFWEGAVGAYKQFIPGSTQAPSSTPKPPQPSSGEPALSTSSPPSR